MKGMRWLFTEMVPGAGGGGGGGGDTAVIIALMDPSLSFNVMYGK